MPDETELSGGEKCGAGREGCEEEVIENIFDQEVAGA